MEKNFKFPPQILENINECSNGGYVLFNFDDQGRPKVFSSADTPMCAMALQMYISERDKLNDRSGDFVAVWANDYEKGAGG